jgi:hypothetical protein
MRILNQCSQGDGLTLAGIVDNDELIPYCETALSGFAGEQVDEILGCNGGGRRILACDETAIHD